MAYSYVRYSGNGSTTNYTFSFPTISTDHIKVRVNGTLVTNWSFLNSSTIQFTAAPASGAVIEIRRETPKDSTIVNFTDGSVLLERDLDLLATYDLYLAQETKDGLDGSISQTSLGVFDGQNKRITNVADPVAPQDVSTKAYTDAIVSLASIEADAAAASAAAAAISETNALASKNAASASAISATNDKNTVQSLTAQLQDGVRQVFDAGTNFTADVTTSLTLLSSPAKSQAVFVFFNGVCQDQSGYTVSGASLNFAQAIPNVHVEVVYFTPSQLVGLTNSDLAQLAAAVSSTEASKVVAVNSATSASSAKVAAEAARDAALIQAGVYATEAAGRAAVADGVAFKVQGSGNVAAFEYRRTNSTTSVLIATYPSSAAVTNIPGTALAARAVTPTKASFFATGKNLFNKATITPGKFMGADGVFVNAAGFCVSDFIAVTPGTSYVSSTSSGPGGMRFTAYFDSSQAWMAGGSNSVGQVSLSVPVGAAFVRVTVEGTGNENSFQLEVGTSVTAYAAFGYELSEVGTPITATTKDSSITEAKIALGAVSPLRTSFLAFGKNLYDYQTITSGAFMGPDGSVVTLAGFSYSDFIPVVAGTQYVISGKSARFTTFFNSSNVVVSGGSSTAVTTFTPPTGAAFVRITIQGGGENTVQIETGSTATAFEKFGYFLKLASGTPIFPTQNALGASIASNWNGKTWASLGDSITAQNTWQPAVATAFGLTHTNYGVGGTTLKGPSGSTTAMCQDARINAIPTTTDLITVLAGVNDWAQDTALGSTNSTDPLTFNGALNTLMIKMSTRFPAKRVVLMTTTYGELYGAPASYGWPNAATNNAGLTLWDYAEAVRNAGKRWGTPVIDISGKVGWNTTNIRTYISDDGGLLHPNATGGKRMSEVVIGDLRNIELLA